MKTPTAYPLAWPTGWKRVPPDKRKVTQFRTGKGSVTLTDALDRLYGELSRLDGRDPLVSSNLEARLDGRPRAGQNAPSDPGVAVYFQFRRRPMVLACDRWTTVAGNLAAIASHIGTMRSQERWGVGGLEQAFTGYQALPGPLVPDDWRSVLGAPATLAEAEAFYRERIKVAHPDAGGSATLAAALNAAIDAARKAAW